MIHPDTNAERELIVSSLKKVRLCKNVKRITIAKPYQLRNRVVTGYLEADGNLTICEL
jgi:intein-encoded DNA endonuclease-like protein